MYQNTLTCTILFRYYAAEGANFRFVSLSFWRVFVFSFELATALEFYAVEKIHVYACLHRIKHLDN